MYMPTPIFKRESAINALLYLANKLTEMGQECEMMKLFKLLYFADQEHLNKYGRTITGDKYIAMEKGPVPSETYHIVQANRKDDYAISRYAACDDFEVEEWFRIRPSKEANTDYLSESDIEVLDNVLLKYGKKSSHELSQLSHNYAWKRTQRNQVIDIADIVREAGGNTEYVEYIVDGINFENALNHVRN